MNSSFNFEICQKVAFYILGDAQLNVQYICTKLSWQFVPCNISLSLPQQYKQVNVRITIRRNPTEEKGTGCSGMVHYKEVMGERYNDVDV